MDYSECDLTLEDFLGDYESNALTEDWTEALHLLHIDLHYEHIKDQCLDYLKTRRRLDMNYTEGDE